MTRTALPLILCVLAAACGSDSVDATAADTSSAMLDDATTGEAAEDTQAEEADTSALEPEVKTRPEPIEEPAASSCNPIANTGCAEGEKCIYDESDAKICAPAGQTPGGAPCQDTAECMEGMCLQLNGTEPYCYTFCKTIGHCPDNAPCQELQDSPYKVCKIDDLYDNCNILAQDCEAGKGCYSVASEDLPVCIPEGDSPLGGECEGPIDCIPGAHCVNFRCYELCDKNDPNACGLFGKCSSTVAAGVGYCDEQQP